ncbi:MAG: RNA polymerase sigma factor [Acidobacteria bacterium]|nr:RNA polymerase sigma factor [Acidobacteriota bacterium]
MTREESTALLMAAKAGSAEALGRLYQRVSGRLLAVIRIRMGRDLRSRMESRDILQSTLLRSFERLDQFAGGDGATLMAWLARIAENEIRDQADFQHRQRRDIAASIPLDQIHEVMATRVRSAFSQVAIGEEATRLEAALEALDADYREVVVLRKLEELSFKEIAARMGRTEDACRMLLARAMVALTLKLRELA